MARMVGGLARRWAGLDAGGSGRDTELEQALVRDTGRQDRCKGEQEPVRAGQPKDRLGSAQKA